MTNQREIDLFRQLLCCFDTKKFEIIKNNIKCAKSEICFNAVCYPQYPPFATHDKIYAIDTFTGMGQHS